MEGLYQMGMSGVQSDASVMGRINENNIAYYDGGDYIEGGGAASGVHIQGGGGVGGSAASSDECDEDNVEPPRKKYHRHTPYQIQELEALFRECPHPDDKQRSGLGVRIGLDPKQIKFWFQNRRTQMKTQVSKHENVLLKQENDRLMMENAMLRKAYQDRSCHSCGTKLVPHPVVDPEVNQTRITNARLVEELTRLSCVAHKLIGHPLPEVLKKYIPSAPSLSSSLGLAMGSGGFGRVKIPSPQFSDGAAMSSISNETMYPKEVYMDLAVSAMDELVKMAEMDNPLWIKDLDGKKDILDQEEHLRIFPRRFGPKPNGFVTEASRETGLVFMNSSSLVEVLMDADRWAEMFQCMVSRAFTIATISDGSMLESKDGVAQVMVAEFQVLSPLVPVRQVKFLRFCKQYAENLFAVVDVSIDPPQEGSSQNTYVACKRLPSGCIVQDMPDNCSKVTWIEHSEYDESIVHNLCRSLVRSGMGFGALRAIATLQRQAENLVVLTNPGQLGYNNSGMNPEGRKSMLKLADRMTFNFCAGVCASSVRRWDELNVGTLGCDVRFLTRNSLGNHGEPPGVVLYASTSVWIPALRQKLFNLMSDEKMRCHWDILSSGGPMEAVAYVRKGQGRDNSVSLLRASVMNADAGGMLILQETWNDASGSLIVFAPVDLPSMMIVMNGGDSSSVSFLPSGFSILPDSRGEPTYSKGGESGGSILTIGYQILVSSSPTAKLTVESVETVNSLMSCTIQKIKAAIGVGQNGNFAA